MIGVALFKVSPGCMLEVALFEVNPGSCVIGVALFKVTPASRVIGVALFKVTPASRVMRATLFWVSPGFRVIGFCGRVLFIYRFEWGASSRNSLGNHLGIRILSTQSIGLGMFITLYGLETKRETGTNTSRRLILQERSVVQYMCTCKRLANYYCVLSAEIAR